MLRGISVRPRPSSPPAGRASHDRQVAAVSSGSGITFRNCLGLAFLSLFTVNTTNVLPEIVGQWTRTPSRSHFDQGAELGLSPGQPGAPVNTRCIFQTVTRHLDHLRVAAQLASSYWLSQADHWLHTGLRAARRDRGHGHARAREPLTGCSRSTVSGL